MIRLIFLCIVLTFSLAFSAISKDFSVMDFGAVADGKTDCTSAFQNALDEAAKIGGGTVHVPTGDFAIRGNLIIKSGVFLQGTFKAPSTNRNDHQALASKGQNGSLILAYAGKGDPDGKPFITLEGSNNGLIGLIIYYPEWSQEEVPPIPYPPCIAGFIGDCQSVIDCLLQNPYEGMRFVGTGRVFIRNVFGYPIKRGLLIDQCYDISRVENCHFWPFGVNYVATDPYCEWINKNGIAFEFARTDWQYVINTFCFGYGAGYKFSEYEHGGCNGNFLGIGADSCKYAVLVEASQDPGILITNGEFVGRWSSRDSVPLEIKETAKGKVSIVNSSFWGPIDTSIRTESDAFLSVIGCHFQDWDVNNNDTPAITLKKGNVIIQGNTFNDKPKHISIGKDVNSAIITGNMAIDALNIDNNIGNKAQIALNKPGNPLPTGNELISYILILGKDLDTKYVKNFYPAEAGGEFKEKDRKRWSSGDAKIILPVKKNTKYNVSFQIYMPEFALKSGAGIYLNGKNILPINEAGEQTLTAQVSTGSSEKLTFEIKVNEWKPQDFIPENVDTRVIGIGVREIKFVSNSKEKIFDFNTMKYIN